MRGLILCVVGALSFYGFMCAPTWGQDSRENMLMGEIDLPRERPESVQFEIQDGEGGFTILSMKYRGDNFEIKNFSRQHDDLIFTWEPGEVEANCTLRKTEEQGYLGACQFPDSETSIGLTLFPVASQESTTGSGEEPVVLGP